MPQERAIITDSAEISPRVSEFKRLKRVLLNRRLAMFGLVVILGLIIVAIFAPLLAPYDPYEINLGQILLKPCGEHLLGTDSLGRDTLSRIIYGSRTSLVVGIFAVGLAVIVGMTMGLLAGYFGGIVFTVIMRFIDTLMSFPPLVLSLVIAAALGGGLRNVIIALGIGVVPEFARLMCGQVLSVKENDYIMATRTVGASDPRIMLRHVIPNSLPPLIVLMTMVMGLVILAEAGLSFLGIGIEPPGAAWGAMVNDGYKYLFTHPVLSFAPGLAIMLVVFAFNMLGDGLRDALDPRLRGTI